MKCSLIQYNYCKTDVTDYWTFLLSFIFREPFTFDEFLNNKFSAKYFRGSWWSNTELLIKDDFGNLVTWNVVDQTCKQSHYAANTISDFVLDFIYIV